MKMNKKYLNRIIKEELRRAIRESNGDDPTLKDPDYGKANYLDGGHQTGGYTEDGEPFGWTALIKDEPFDWTALIKDDTALSSWIKFINRQRPDIKVVLEALWDEMISGEIPVPRDKLKAMVQNSLNEPGMEMYKTTINSGIKFHGIRLKPGVDYPSSEEIRQLSDQKKADAKRDAERAKEERIEKTTLPIYDDDSGALLATVTKGSVKSIREIISQADKASRGRYYADSHEMWRPVDRDPDLTPAGAYKKLMQMRQGLPGGVTIYIDPETEEVFGYAKYNTF